MEYSRAATPLNVTSDGVTSAARRLWSSWPAFLVGALLSITWAYFAIANFASWRHTHQPTGLGASLLELTAAVFFLIRRPARVTSSSMLAWGATAVVSFGMLAARPGDGNPVAGLEPLYATLQLVGWALAVVCISTLGRSFGLVAANRGIVTSGPYRIVRHPVYTCYLLTQAGYVLENPTARNCAVICATVLFQLVRIHTEEQCLQADPEYVAYRSRVQWRLIPRVY